MAASTKPRPSGGSATQQAFATGTCACGAPDSQWGAGRCTPCRGIAAAHPNWTPEQVAADHADTMLGAALVRCGTAARGAAKRGVRGVVFTSSARSQEHMGKPIEPLGMLAGLGRVVEFACTDPETEWVRIARADGAVTEEDEARVLAHLHIPAGWAVAERRAAKSGGVAFRLAPKPEDAPPAPVVEGGADGG